MALTIGTNVASLQASAAASSVNRDLETSMARLSTGKRINSAADDAAGVAIASRLSSEIRGTDQAIRNALDGQALIDTAEGGHKEIEAILQRMREVSVQAASDTNNAQDRGNLNAEMKALTTEIDRIAGVTTWAGNSVMDGGGGATTTASPASKTFSLQVGAATGTKNQIAVAINAMDAKTLGISGADSARVIGDIVASSDVPVNGAGAVGVFTSAASGTVTAAVATMTFEDGFATGTAEHTFSSDTAYAATTATAAEATVIGAEIAAKINSDATMIGLGIGASSSDAGVVTLNFKSFESLDTSAQARDAIKNIDAAIKTVNTQRSELGAVSNRLSHTVSNMTNISTNLSAARGGIEDADFALETTNLAKNQILQQASTAMLAQANASKQNVLSLLKG
jgi:flagellin